MICDNSVVTQASSISSGISLAACGYAAMVSLLMPAADRSDPDRRGTEAGRLGVSIRRVKVANPTYGLHFTDVSDYIHVVNRSR